MSVRPRPTLDRGWSHGGKQDQTLKAGDRVVVYGGYDIDPAWLAVSPTGYSVVEFISGQNDEPAAVIALDEELLLPAGAGAMEGKEVRGTFLVLELGLVGAHWSTKTPRVHVELCDERPSRTAGRTDDRERGSSRMRPTASRPDRVQLRLGHQIQSGRR